MTKHTFSAFWLRSSVVSVLISLISGTCYTVTNEINCDVSAAPMDPALGLLTLLGRGPGIAVLPGAARRYAYIKKNHNNNNKNICFGDHCVWNVAVVKLFLEFLLGVKNNVPINRSLPAGTI